MKLLIPIGLGVVAFGLNYFLVSEQTTPQQYSFVAVERDIPRGKLFTEEKLTKVEMSGVSKTLRQTAIPWSQRSVLVGRPSGRDLRKGDLVFWRDKGAPQWDWNLKEGEVVLFLSVEGISAPLPLLQAGDEIVFKVAEEVPKSPPGASRPPQPPRIRDVGPFRVLSIGNTLSNFLDPFSKSSRVSDKTIGVAVKFGNDPEADALTREILTVKWKEMTGRRQILGVVLKPANRSNPSP